jgi:septal ring factor EnvC (AmiA/AmiB activator)
MIKIVGDKIEYDGWLVAEFVIGTSTIRDKFEEFISEAVSESKESDYALESEIEDLNSDISSLERELNEADAENEELRARAISAEMNNDELEAKIEELEDQLEHITRVHNGSL